MDESILQKGNKEIKCENCGNEFSKKEDLEEHMKEDHPKCQCTGEDVCDDCLGRMTRQVISLLPKCW